MRSIEFIRKIFTGVLLIFFLVVLLSGCSAPKPVVRGETPSPPPPVDIPVKEFYITVGSIDLSYFPRKIEKSDIRKLSSMLKKDSVDILTIQGITRYPELKNRLDLIDELSAATDMASAFGETMTLTGRQSGNGIFSHFPIRSYESTQYSGLRSTRFESALQAIIDCGEREIVIVSTRLPDNISDNEQATIVSTLGGFRTFYVERPVIISGNLILPQNMRALTSYSVVEKGSDKTLPKFWYSDDNALKVSEYKIKETSLGKMIHVRFIVSLPPQP